MSERSDGERLDSPITLKLGHEELLIRRRYETISIGNDFLIAIWFLIGSVFFLDNSMVTDGTWLFILGSAQLAIRPALRLAAHIHLQRVPATKWES